jgi:hypothetical protein
MKKTVLVFFFLFMGIMASSTAQTAAAPTVDLKQYVAKFKFEGAPFETIEVILAEDGKLYGDAGESGRAELVPTEKPDVMNVTGYDGTCEFIRDENKKIIKVSLSVMGNTFEGTIIE